MAPNPEPGLHPASENDADQLRLDQFRITSASELEWKPFERTRAPFRVGRPFIPGLQRSKLGSYPGGEAFILQALLDLAPSV